MLFGSSPSFFLGNMDHLLVKNLKLNVDGPLDMTNFEVLLSNECFRVIMSSYGQKRDPGKGMSSERFYSDSNIKLSYEKEKRGKSLIT